MNRHLAKLAISEKDAIAAGTKIASESILNIRTVASLSECFCFEFRKKTQSFHKLRFGQRNLYFLCILRAGLEKHTVERFMREMEQVERLACKKVRFRGLVNSFSQAVPQIAYVVALYYGGLMVANDEIHYKNLIRFVCGHF